jgi:thiol-disulfide isomerase/thioredoxin
MKSLILVLILLITPASAGGRDPFIEEDVFTFAFPDLEGRTVSSSDPEFRGKVLLVDLWGTWCPPCVSEIPTFVDLQQRFGDQGLTIVAIAFESDDEGSEARRERLRDYVKHHGINYLVLDGGSPEKFGEALPQIQNVRGFPIEILIDRDGTVADVRNSYGYKKKWARKLERELVELLEAGAEPDDG